ncbi:MAG: hypothetical protein Q7J06_09060, partial [Bacteroidales bacterium]|nr:hypothetical protein [Bacteroidales bacterium]
NFVVFSAPENVSVTKADPGVESVTVTIEPVPGLDVTEMPAGIDPQEAYVVEPTGTGSFTLIFTDVSNASDIRVYKVVDGTWTLLDTTVVGETTIKVTMEVGDPILVFAAPATYDVLINLNDNGWTLVSTDKYILSSGDNTSAFLGSVSLIYKYTDSGYLSATVADLKPVEAIYVKTTGTDGQLGLNYSGAVPVPSSKDLVAGWNLISSATANNAAAVLSPLRYVQVGEQQGVGLTTLVSQGSYNLSGVSFYLATLTDADWSAVAPTSLAFTMLSPFDGYWVYMNVAKSFGVIPQ